MRTRMCTSYRGGFWEVVVDGRARIFVLAGKKQKKERERNGRIKGPEVSRE